MAKKFFIPEPHTKKLPLFGWDKPWLAPLAGYTDLPFRMLCNHYGAAVCTTEMISAAGLKAESQATADLLLSTNEEECLIVQLFGSDIESMGSAVALLRKKGWLWFDCNLGCPAKKVLRQGAGAALLEDTQKALAIAKAMLYEAGRYDENNINPAAKGLVGFKLRLGLDKAKKIVPDLALRLEDLGAAWITLHPRYGKQGFTGRADWNEIDNLAQRLSIPLIASGDLLTAEDGLCCLHQTGASGLMYGRGALYNPAIFAEHSLLLKKNIKSGRDHISLCQTVLLHIDYARKYYPNERGFYKIRSILPRYVRFHPGVGQFRQILAHCNDWDSLINEVNIFMENKRG